LVGRTANRLFAGEAIELFCAPIPVDDCAWKLPDEDCVVREVEESGLLLQRLFCPLALGDVFASDQDDWAVRPVDSSGRFADPEHRAVLADLAQFPVHRAAQLFKAETDVSLSGVSVGFIKDIQHGMTD